MTRNRIRSTRLNALTLPGAELKDWNVAWKRFCQQHRVWCERLSMDDPVYHLPQTVTDTLAKGETANDVHRAKSQLLCPEDVSAEREFREMCLNLGADVVGTWKNQPVRYPL